MPDGVVSWQSASPPVAVCDTYCGAGVTGCCCCCCSCSRRWCKYLSVAWVAAAATQRRVLPFAQQSYVRVVSQHRCRSILLVAIHIASEERRNCASHSRDCSGWDVELNRHGQRSAVVEYQGPAWQHGQRWVACTAVTHWSSVSHWPARPAFLAACHRDL